MKNIKYIILLILVQFTGLIYAQENQSLPKVDEMHNRKWEFLVDKTKLTPKQIEDVQPVFMEYEKALWNFHVKNVEYFKSFRSRKNDPTLNYSEINDRYAEIEVTQAQFFKSYHLKLKKILPPETLYKYYHAEREFKKNLLQNLQNHKQERKPADNSNL